MSSTLVHLLVYVMPPSTCSLSPIILPLNRCLEVQVGVSITFDLYAQNLCNPDETDLSVMIIANKINGMNNGNLTKSSTNNSLSYMQFT